MDKNVTIVLDGQAGSCGKGKIWQNKIICVS